MSLKRNTGIITACLLMTACGSASDEDSGSGAFVRFAINGLLDPASVEVERRHLSVDAEDENLQIQDPCDPAQFGNASEVLTTHPEYCAQEANLAIVNFDIQFFNGSNEEDLTVEYIGQGFTIRVYEYDANAADNRGQEVWNSDYFAQVQVESARLQDDSIADFDPDAEHSVVLKPSYAIPNQSSSAVASFYVDRNVINPDLAFNPDNLAVVPDPDQCFWGLVESDDADVTYEKVICRNPPLLPLPSADNDTVYRYIASVEINFNGWTNQPDDIDIYIKPPEYPKL